MAISPVPYEYRYNFSVDNDAVDNTYTLKILGAALDCSSILLLMCPNKLKRHVPKPLG